MKNTAEFFSSARLTIVLLIILTAVSLVGIIIPQGLMPQKYFTTWSFAGEATVRALLFIGVDHVFTTLWFYLVMFIFSCNILVCSATRLWRNTVSALKKGFLSSANDIGRCRYRASGEIRQNLDSTRDSIVSRLKKLGYSLTIQKEPSGGYQIAGRKGALKDIGSLVFHLSIILLFIGGLIGGRFGYSVISDLSRNEVIQVPDRSFLLRCDWFKLEQNEDGTVKDYKSKLSILRPDSSLITEKIIEVNDPLSYNGIRFYQARYGQSSTSIIDALVSIAGPGLPAPAFKAVVPYGKPFGVPGTDLTLTLSDFLPDFTIDMETRVATSRSSEPNNPAMRATLCRGNDTLFRNWLFVNYPNQHAGKGPFTIMADSYTPDYSTGIQVRENPGVPLIWAGIIAMTIGIFAVFYISKKSIWVFIRPRTQNGCELTVGGSSNRTTDDFDREFDVLETKSKQTNTQEA